MLYQLSYFRNLLRKSRYFRLRPGIRVNSSALGLHENSAFCFAVGKDGFEPP